ncbi:GyrI-like domain-containing protein [candidate division FCPU426 bacterium]|nr:GyrI-like domain-containing protein [candidate division FCPU426 bacterium]
MWKFIGFILFFCLAGLAATLWLAGMFDKPEFTEREMGPYTLIYKRGEGEYQQGAVLNEAMKSWLAQHGVRSERSFTWYFDNPQNTESGNLRYITGHIFTFEDEAKRMEVAERYLIKEFPRQLCLVGLFPFRSRLSVMFGLMKVYSALDAIREKKNYPARPIMELYDKANKQIVYLQPVAPAKDLLDEYFSVEDEAAVDSSQPPGTQPAVTPTPGG